MKITLMRLCYSLLFIVYAFSSQAQTNQKKGRDIWTIEKANAWYKTQPWLVGSNFIPSYAINQLECWQPETFDTTEINKELGMAEKLGMNTMRVFLHDLLFQQDEQGFYKRINQFLNIASRHHIKPLFVLFDSVWDPYPHTGKQKEPTPYVHNSGWVQSPGADALMDSLQYPRLKKYVSNIILHFAKDTRILAWDVWNEPDNTNGGLYHKQEPANKQILVNALLKKVFVWARNQRPTQPLTAGLWNGDDWSSINTLNPTAQISILNSDIITFHNYDDPKIFKKKALALMDFKRPVICTEYMARPRNSTFQNILPISKRYHIGMYNWGFVEGKSQTNYPWDSWDKTYTAEPPLWFHDIFRKDGSPYKQNEVDFIKEMIQHK